MAQKVLWREILHLFPIGLCAAVAWPNNATSRRMMIAILHSGYPVFISVESRLAIVFDLFRIGEMGHVN
jgi:hypothetical protein